MRGTGSSGQRRLRRRCGAVPRLSSCEGCRSCRRLLGLSSEEASLTRAGASLPRVTSGDARLRRSSASPLCILLRPAFAHWSWRPSTHHTAIQPNQHKKPRNPGVYWLLTFIPSFQPHRFDPRLPDRSSCMRIRHQFGIDLVDLERRENVGQLGHVLDDFAHNHASVHDFDAA